MSATIDTAAVHDLALRMIALESPSGGEEAVAGLVGDELRQLGFTVDVDALGNVVGTLDLGPGPRVLFDCHTDTVGVRDPSAWTRDPGGEIADGRLYGRGAMDMKGPLAACIHGVAALRGRAGGGQVVVSASVAEEVAEGAAFGVVCERLRPDQVVICEATSLRVATGHRGRAEVTVEVEGRSAHSARPELGINAAEAMADFIRALRDVELPTHPTLGDAVLVLTDVVSSPYPGQSVIPERCRATFDRRTLPGETQADVLAPIEAMLEAVGATGRASIAIDDLRSWTGAELTAPRFAPAWDVAQDAPVVLAALEALAGAGLPAEVSRWAFCTNGSASAGRLGISTIGYGPGDERQAHRVDEHIELAALDDGARGYAALAAGLLAFGGAS